MHIAIAGNIGVGKTTLAEKLAENFGWEVCYESVQDNPYLEDFYADMPRWAFHLQVYFLNNRFKQVKYAQNTHHTVIQDRTIYEDAYIFAQTLYEKGTLSQRDYENYLNIFHTFSTLIKPPDLLIYLKADVPKLKNHIQKRGRHYEQDIPYTYLEDLNRHYETWISNYQEGPVLIKDVCRKDFLLHSADWEEFKAEIQEFMAIKKLGA